MILIQAVAHQANPEAERQPPTCRTDKNACHHHERLVNFFTEQGAREDSREGKNGGRVGDGQKKWKDTRRNIRFDLLARRGLGFQEMFYAEI